MYIGVTSDLVKRVYEHKHGVHEGFTKRYNVKELVFFEVHNNAESAITREKRLKRWDRSWKVQLIEKKNSGWTDLFPGLLAN